MDLSAPVALPPVLPFHLGIVLDDDDDAGIRSSSVTAGKKWTQMSGGGTWRTTT